MLSTCTFDEGEKEMLKKISGNESKIRGFYGSMEVSQKLACIEGRQVIFKAW